MGILSSPVILSSYIPILKSVLDNIFVRSIWSFLYLIFIIAAAYKFKIDYIQLTTKESILFNLEEGVFFLELFLHKMDKKDFKKSKRYFNRLESQLLNFNLTSNGFELEVKQNNVMSRFLIYLRKEFLPLLDIDLKKTNFLKIRPILEKIFNLIVTEKFSELDSYLEGYTKRYEVPEEKTYKNIFKQIHSSNLLLTLVYLVLIVVLDIIGAVIFNLLNLPYNHYAAIILLIAFFAGVKPSIDFLRNAIKNIITPTDKKKKK